MEFPPLSTSFFFAKKTSDLLWQLRPWFLFGSFFWSISLGEACVDVRADSFMTATKNHIKRWNSTKIHSIVQILFDYSTNPTRGTLSDVKPQHSLKNSLLFEAKFVIALSVFYVFAPDIGEDELDWVAQPPTRNYTGYTLKLLQLSFFSAYLGE